MKPEKARRIRQAVESLECRRLMSTTYYSADGQANDFVSRDDYGSLPPVPVSDVPLEIVTEEKYSGFLSGVDQVHLGLPFSGRISIRNDSELMGAVTIKAFLSTDDVLDSADPLLMGEHGTFGAGSVRIASGQSISLTADGRLNVGTVGESYRIIYSVEGVNAPIAGGPLVWMSEPFTIGTAPEVAGVSVSAPASAKLGAEFEVSGVMAGDLSERYMRRATIYLSIDDIAGNEDDLAMGAVYGGDLTDGTLTGAASTKQLLGLVAAGTYRIVMKVDLGNLSHELNEADNYVLGDLITLTEPAEEISNVVNPPAGEPAAPSFSIDPSVISDPALVTDVQREEDSLSVSVMYRASEVGWREVEEGVPLGRRLVSEGSLGDGDLILTLADGRQIAATFVSSSVAFSSTNYISEFVVGNTVTPTSVTGVYRFEGITPDMDLSGAVLSVVDGAIETGGYHDQIIGANLDATAFGIGTESGLVPGEGEGSGEGGEEGQESPVVPAPEESVPVESGPESSPLVSASGISTETVGGVTLKRGKVKFQVRVTNTSDEKIKGPARFSVAVVDAATGEASGDNFTLKRRVNLGSGESKVVSYSRKLSREDAEMLAASAKLAISTEAPAVGDSASASDELFCDVAVLA